jgi:hypothetical protein
MTAFTVPAQVNAGQHAIRGWSARLARLPIGSFSEIAVIFYRVLSSTKDLRLVRSPSSSFSQSGERAVWSLGLRTHTWLNHLSDWAARHEGGHRGYESREQQGAIRSDGQTMLGHSVSVSLDSDDLAAASWRKSSKSAYNGSCVEVAELRSERVGVRDTKAHDAGPILIFTHAEWNLFLSRVKLGSLDFR